MFMRLYFCIAAVLCGCDGEKSKVTPVGPGHNKGMRQAGIAPETQLSALAVKFEAERNMMLDDLEEVLGNGKSRLRLFANTRLILG